MARVSEQKGEERSMTPRTARGRAAILLLALPLVALAVSGCPREADQPGAESAQPADATPEPVVYARVNGTPITDQDLHRAVADRLGGAAFRALGPAARREALESLVLQRAMAMEVERTLEPERRESLDALVKAYREALLAQEFVRRATMDVPFTEEMVEQYWRENPKLFGQRTLKRYEMLRGQPERDEARRARALELLAEAEQLANGEGEASAWRELAARAEAQEVGLVHAEGELRPGLLAPRVEKIVASLSPGEISAVVLVDRVPYLVRVIAERTTPPSPYAEVRELARERLQAIELKKAVEGMKDEVLARAEVEYLAAAPQRDAGSQ